MGSCAICRDDTFASLIPRLSYIDGDLRDVTTFARVRVALGAVRHPLHYLAIPPSLFAATVQGLAHAGCTQSAHVAVEKPFGHDLASAQELNAVLRGIFDEPAILRVDHFLAKEPLQSLLYFRCANTFVEPLWNREHIRSVQITMAEDFGVGTRGQFYDHVGATQDVVQNHVLQVLAMLAMEPPAAADAEAMHASRIRLLEAVRPVAEADAVRGQYTGYRDIEGVAPDSNTETFVALRLAIESARWRGVTTTEAWVELQPPAQTLYTKLADVLADHFRFRLGPGSVETVVGGSLKQRGAGMIGEAVAFKVHQDDDYDSDAYVRLLGDALMGDRTVFDRAPAIEAAWRIVAALQDRTRPAEPYEPGTWGPASADRPFGLSGHWHNPEP